MVRFKIIKTKAGPRRIKVRSRQGTRQDQQKRSKQKWERGRGARKIGNPRYKPVIRNGRKVYILRKR